jgi:hypothetical protein
VPVLTDEQNPILLIDGRNRDGSWMLKDIALNFDCTKMHSVGAD